MESIILPFSYEDKQEELSLKAYSDLLKSTFIIEPTIVNNIKAIEETIKAGINILETKIFVYNNPFIKAKIR